MDINDENNEIVPRGYSFNGIKPVFTAFSYFLEKRNSLRIPELPRFHEKARFCPLLQHFLQNSPFLQHLLRNNPFIMYLLRITPPPPFLLQLLRNSPFILYLLPNKGQYVKYIIKGLFRNKCNSKGLFRNNYFFNGLFRNKFYIKGLIRNKYNSVLNYSFFHGAIQWKKL